MSLIADAADTTLKVMYVGLPQVGPAVAFAQAYAKNLKVPTEFVSMKDCASALKAIDESDNVVYLISSTNTVTSTRRGVECVPKFKPEDMVYYTDNYFNYCRKPDNKKNFLRDRITMGHASVIPMMGIANDLNIQNGTSIVSVPFQSTPQVLTGIINGDVDWGMAIVSVSESMIASKQIECPYTTDPRAANFIGRQLRGTSPDFTLSYIMAIKTKDPAIRAEATRAAQSKEFGEFLTAGKFVNVKTSNFEQKDIDKFNQRNAEVITNFLP